MITPINVLILSESGSFPWGMAAANRIRNLAKGLISNQCEVEYIGLRGADVLPSEDMNKRGVFEGIKYVYPGGFPARPTNWWERRMDDLCGTCLPILHVLHKKISGKLDLIIIYSRNHRIVSFWCRILHLLHIPVVLEVCEWPLARVLTYKQESYRKANKFSFNALPKVDAVLPISTYIDNEIRKISASMNKNMPSFIIPILIDIEPEKLPPKTKSDETYLLYSGVNYWDIAQTVINTLHELKCRGINLHVKFTGGGSNWYLDNVKQYAAKKGVLQQLEFTGIVKEKELYLLMSEAMALLAPLPENLLTKARFSTKLGYYLMSGSPVVTNAVGDIGSYLQDGVNAFVAEKYNPEQLSNKIEKILNDPGHAEEVGRNGQKLAFEKFYYSTACKGLNDFLQGVITNYR